MASDERGGPQPDGIGSRVLDFLQRELLPPGTTVGLDDDLLAGEVLDSIDVLRLAAFVAEAFRMEDPAVGFRHRELPHRRDYRRVRRARPRESPEPDALVASMTSARPSSHSRDGVPPSNELTHSQKSIWIGQRLHPASPLYNMAFAFVFPAVLRTDLFCEAWQRVVDASDALRTRVVEDEGGEARWQLAAHGRPTEVLELTPGVDPVGEFAGGRASGALARCRSTATSSTRARRAR